MKRVVPQRQHITKPLLHIKRAVCGYTAWIENVFTTAILTRPSCLPVAIFFLILFFSTHANCQGVILLSYLILTCPVVARLDVSLYC